MMGDPTHVANMSWNAGSSIKDGVSIGNHLEMTDEV
jgi:hypothetical protein